MQNCILRVSETLLNIKFAISCTLKSASFTNGFVQFIRTNYVYFLALPIYMNSTQNLVKDYCSFTLFIDYTVYDKIKCNKRKF